MRRAASDLFDDAPSSAIPAGRLAIMNQRHEPAESLDFFPTQPWATRAFFKHVLLARNEISTAFDPCCGEGHMAEIIRDYGVDVFASDIFDYGYKNQSATFNFLDLSKTLPSRHWIICNPPYGDNLIAFVKRAIFHQQTLSRMNNEATGVAMLMRNTVIAGQRRFYEIYNCWPVSTYAPFSERVAMIKDNYDPSASTATDYAWYVWRFVYGKCCSHQRLKIIPPCRNELERQPEDSYRFHASCRVKFGGDETRGKYD